MPAPEIAISVTTYQKPWHLRRVLASIAGQLGVDGKFEVAVTDDGSTDETSQIVEEFRRRGDFPVRFTTHEHTVFHPARAATTGRGPRRRRISSIWTATAFCLRTMWRFIWLAAGRVT